MVKQKRWLLQEQQSKDENKAKARARYKVDLEKKKASGATATRVSPVISLHVVDNTYVYYSRLSRTSNQKKRSKQRLEYPQKQDENKIKARARYKSDSEMKASVCDSYKASPEKVSPSHKSSRG